MGRNDPCPCGSGRKYKHCCALRPPSGADGTPEVDAGELAQAIGGDKLEGIMGALRDMDEKDFEELLEDIDTTTEEEIDEFLEGEGGPRGGPTPEDLTRLLGATGSLEEDEAWEIALKDHPEYAGPLRRGKLPNEILDPDGNPMNPRVHLAMHAVLERQLAEDKPRGVVDALDRLIRAGVDRHEAVHAMANLVVQQIWYMLREHCPFDEERYVRELRQLVREWGKRR